MRCETGGPAPRPPYWPATGRQSWVSTALVRAVPFLALVPRSAPASIAEQGRAEDLRVAMIEGARRGPHRSRSRADVRRERHDAAARGAARAFASAVCRHPLEGAERRDGGREGRRAKAVRAVPAHCAILGPPKFHHSASLIPARRRIDTGHTSGAGLPRGVQFPINSQSFEPAFPERPELVTTPCELGAAQDKP
jgi:hypothetical protein